MTLIVDIPDELMGKIAAEARVLGLDLPTYAATLIEQAARPVPGVNRLTKQELEETLDEIAQFSNKIPLLPDEALSRESLYQDHD